MGADRNKIAWTQLCQGDLAGLETLFNEFHGPLLRFCNRMLRNEHTTEDLVQELFLKLWQQHERLPASDNPKAYLYRMAHHACIDSIRQTGGKLHEGDIAAADEPRDPITPEDLLHLDELQQTVMALIATLPPACAQVFTLVRLEGMSYQEAADALELSIRTVENQMGKALKLLRAAAGVAASRGQIGYAWVAHLLIF